MWAELVEAAANGDKRAQRILNWVGWMAFILMIGVAGGVLFVLFQLYLIMNSAD